METSNSVFKFLCFRWHLQFIKSEFKGQLPKPYGKFPQATRKIPSHMNDMNEEEPTRYVSACTTLRIFYISHIYASIHVTPQRICVINLSNVWEMGPERG